MAKGRRQERRTAAEDGLSRERLEKELRRSQMERRRSRRARGVLIALLAALAAGILISNHLFMLVTVLGSSMSPTMENGSVALCARYGVDDIGRGDLVLFRYEGALLVKRVIGVPGDEIEVDRYGALKVNGETLEEEYLTVQGAEGGDLVYPVTVPAEHLFVLGDHRGIVADSRSRAFGMVPKVSVLGKPLMVVWPLFSARPLTS